MIGLRLTVIVSVVALPIGFAQADSNEVVPAAECAACHEEVVHALARTPHAVAPGWDEDAACASCHGPGREHVDSGGDVDLIVRPGDLTPRESSQVCVDCHQRQRRHFRGARSVHRLADVGCIDCHNPHSSEDLMLERTGSDLCSDCHQGIAAEFELPRSHPFGGEDAECSSCHDPHGKNSLRSSTLAANKTCGSCHFEKAGPFLFQHDVGLIDGCSACHEVHGSPNRHLLKHETQVNLCYQCHSASATPAWHSAPRFLNEKCTACHSAIHGSNTSHVFLEE